MFGRVLSIPRILSMLGLEYTRVVNIPRFHKVLCKLYFKLHGILNVLRSEYAEICMKFCMYQESKYGIVTKGSE